MVETVNSISLIGRQEVQSPVQISHDGEYMANALDWEILDKYGPGQEKGLRHSTHNDPDTVEEIARAHMIKAEHPVLTRAYYVALRAKKREAYMDGQAQANPDKPKIPNGADVHAQFILSRSRNGGR